MTPRSPVTESLDGARVVVTGATSGLGRAMAEALAAAGARVGVTSRSRERAEATARELGPAVVGFELDVRDERSVAVCVAEARERFGGIDTLVNNAGIGMRTVNPGFLSYEQPFWQGSPSGFRDVLETKVTGVFLVARARCNGCLRIHTDPARLRRPPTCEMIGKIMLGIESNRVHALTSSAIRGPPADRADSAPRDRSTSVSDTNGGASMNVIASITTSVDGYVAGPDDGPGVGLGRGGERLHYWVMGGPWTYDNAPEDFAMSGADKEFLDELTGNLGAGVCGRGMYDSSEAWGGSNPFDGPLFVVTHRTEDAPDPSTGFHFVDGLEAAMQRATGAAAGRDVSISGGADVIRQALAGGYVDELAISTAPLVLGGGKRLFDGFEHDVELEVQRVYTSPYATHVRYRVKR